MAKYIELETAEEKHLASLRKKDEQRSLIKKINKASNLELLNLVLTDEIILQNILLMYDSNSSKDFWKSFKDLISFPKKKDSYNKLLIDYTDFLRKLLSISDNAIAFKYAYRILETVIEYKSEFLRTIETWVPKSRNAEQQLYSIIRHLFTKYPTPVFLEKSFLNGFFEGVCMYIHLGAGKSLKNYNGYPDGMIIHNKAAHHLYTTPPELGYFEALRRAQILYMGGDEYIFNALMRSNVIRERQFNTLRNEEFWLSVMKFFIDNTMIESSKIAELIDYIYHVKFQTSRGVIDGRHTEIPPEHPNFSMKGRNPQTLINQSDDWHYYKQRTAEINRRLAIGNNNYGYPRAKYANYTWIGYRINNKTYTKGKSLDGSPIEYKVIQLLSSDELLHEGNYMHHCVGTYGPSCLNGKCAIFSVRHFLYNKQADITATVEVRDDRIVQIRGKYNRKPDDKTISVIENWAKDEYLRINSSAL